MSSGVFIENPLISSVKEPYSKAFQGGGRNVDYRQVTFPNTDYRTQANVKFYPPSTSVLLDRRMLFQADIVITSTATNLPHLVGCLRSMPLNNIIVNCSVGINGRTLDSSNPQELISHQQHIGNTNLFRTRYWGLSPSQPDPCSSYVKCPPTITFTGTSPVAMVQARATADPAGALVAGTFTNTTVAVPYVIPVSWSPFVHERYARDGVESVRSSFPYVLNNANPALATTITYTVAEVLCHPIFTDSEAAALSNIREMSVAVQYDSNLQKCFSAYAAAGDAFTVQIMNPTLLLNYFEAEDVSKIPEKLVLPWTYQQQFAKDMGVVTIGSSQEFAYNTMTLSTVPSKLIIYARKTNKTYRDADGFLTIQKVNLKIGTRGGLLAGLPEQQLWLMSTQNGVNLTYKQYHTRLGSVFVCDIPKNIAGSALITGAQGNLSIDLKVQYANNMWNALDGDAVGAEPNDSFTAYMFAEIEGVLELAKDAVGVQLGASIDEHEAALGNPVLEEHPSDEPLEGSGMHGGASKATRWFRRRRNDIANAFNWVKDELISPALQGAHAVQNYSTELQGQLGQFKSPEAAVIAASGFRRRAIRELGGTALRM